MRGCVNGKKEVCVVKEKVLYEIREGFLMRGCMISKREQCVVKENA